MQVRVRYVFEAMTEWIDINCDPPENTRLRVQIGGYQVWNVFWDKGKFVDPTGVVIPNF